MYTVAPFEFTNSLLLKYWYLGIVNIDCCYIINTKTDSINSAFVYYTSQFCYHFKSTSRSHISFIV